MCPREDRSISNTWATANTGPVCCHQARARQLGARVDVHHERGLCELSLPHRGNCYASHGGRGGNRWVYFDEEGEQGLVQAFREKWVPAVVLGWTDNIHQTDKSALETLLRGFGTLVRATT